MLGLPHGDQQEGRRNESIRLWNRAAAGEGGRAVNRRGPKWRSGEPAAPATSRPPELTWPPDSRLSYLAASFKIIIITRACVCRHRPERNANNPRVDAWCSHGKHANLLLRLLSARWGKWLLSKVRITSRTGVWPGLTVRAKVPPPPKKNNYFNHQPPQLPPQ